MADISHPYSELGRAPINAENPAGINAKYEHTYEELMSELNKLESISSAKIDWSVIRTLSLDLLKNTTKDFSVAAYLAVALQELEGYAGLLYGLDILTQLNENYWETAFPPVKRLRGRKTAIEWFAEKANHYLSNNPVGVNDQQHIIDCAKLLKDLDYSLAEKMGDSAPAITDLSRALKQAKQAAEFELKNKVQEGPTNKPVQSVPGSQQQTTDSSTPVPNQPVTESVADTTPIQSATAHSLPEKKEQSPKPGRTALTQDIVSDISSDADARKAYKQIQEGMRKLADFHAQQKPSDPRRYRLSRSALWDSIDKLPPNKDGKTQLPKPPTDKLKKLKELLQQGDYLEVIQQAEASACKMPYWFDGTHLIVSALEALGAEYQKARDALLEELTQFLRRVPKIIELHYSDGTPFADDQTRFWLSTLAADKQDTPVPKAAADALSEIIKEAEKLTASGKLQEALGRLKAGFIPANMRDQFRVRLAKAELIANAGHTEVAIPLLQQLVENIDTTQVSDWEPDFVARAYDLLVKAYGRTEDNDSQEARSQAFSRLCWLNPILATSV